MTEPLRVFVVAHTHWDREWYRGAGRFRQRLVTLIDELLDDPPSDGESFLLDGQAILIDDYLAVRPERAAELAALLKSGRLEAGPWYVLADNLIPSGEALVRNLLAGRDVLRGLRATAPPVLYCPDSFGHPAVLPDLAGGFGCELVLLWRGYGGARWPSGDVVRWRSVAGTASLLYHLAPDGYELGSSLPQDDASASERWRRLRAVLEPRATLGIALLPNGADHHARQRGQRDAVRALASAALPAHIQAHTLGDFARAVSEAALGTDLPAISGELRNSYGYTWTLSGSLGTRAHQKRSNAMLERSLVRDVEPWLALARDGGDASSRATLRAAWRTLLEGHPHDTLCGTSIELVASALDARHADVADRLEGLRESALATLIGHDAERAQRSLASWRPCVVVRNRTPRRRGGLVELELEATIADVAVGPGSGTRQGARRPMPGWGVDPMPIQILEEHERVALTESPRGYPDADLVAAARAVGWMQPIAGYAVQTFAQEAVSIPGRMEIPTAVSASEHTLDNELLEVELSASGEVRIVDRTTGRAVDGAITLENASDVGDLYTPALRGTLAPPKVRGVRLVHGGPIRGELSLSYVGGSGPNAFVDCHVSLVLDAGAPFLRVHVDGHNTAMDHRLRLRFATGLSGATTIADAAFRPIEREPISISDEDARMEHAVPTAPLHRYVSRYSPEGGATLFSDGLAEYESLEDGAVAVTLVRSVGALSRHDLPERPGHAGWPADTPLAQCRGPYSARFALAFHGPDSDTQRDAVEQLADDVLLPLVGQSLRSCLDAPHRAGGLELLGDGLAFSAAMPARAPSWIVLRCVNRRAATVQGAWRLGGGVSEARLARLDETPLEPLETSAGTIRFTAAPHAIVTILARA